MYAEHKNIALESISIELTHNQNKGSQARNINGKENRTDAIDGYIELKGNLNTDQQRRMLEIAGQCWMHRTLSQGVDIRFRKPSACK